MMTIRRTIYQHWVSKTHVSLINNAIDANRQSLNKTVNFTWVEDENVMTDFPIPENGAVAVISLFIVYIIHCSAKKKKTGT